MSQHSSDSASLLPCLDQDRLPAAEVHHPEQEDGAAVHTELHHLECSPTDAEAGESLPETYSIVTEVKGVDPFTRTRPLYERGPAERGTRRCDGAHQTAPSKMFDDLSDKQQKAIAMLISGKSYTQIAKRLEIDRSTLWRWRNRDSDFRRNLENAREEAYRDADSRLRELVPRALEVLESQLADGDYQTAVRVLRMARVDGQRALQAYESRPFHLGGRL